MRPNSKVCEETFTVTNFTFPSKYVEYPHKSPASTELLQILCISYRQPYLFLLSLFFFTFAHMRKLLRTRSPLRSPLEEAQKLHLLPKGESNHCGRSESVPSSRRTAVFQPGPCVPCACSPHISQPYYLVGTGEGGRHHFKIAAYTQ